MATETLKIITDVQVKGAKDVKDLAKDFKDLEKNAKGVPQATDRVTKSTGLLEGNLRKLVAGGALLTAGKLLLDFGKQSIAAASNVEEMQSKFNTVFKDLAGSTTQELQAFADAANRSIFDLQGFAATLQDTFVPLGFARDEAASMSIELVKLAEDLASFNNLPTEDVVRDLQSALVGNTETLRKYGVVAQETQIKQEAITSGLWDGTGAIDAQAKAQAILNLTIKGTTDAQGDAIATAGSYENTSKGLEAAMTDLKVAIGQGLLPQMTELKTRTTGVVAATADFWQIAVQLREAEERGIITKGEYVRELVKVQTTSYDAADAQKFLEEAVSEVEAKAEGATLNVEKLAEAEVDAATAAEAATLATIEYSAALAEARGPNEELADKIQQTGNRMSETEAAVYRGNAAFRDNVAASEEASGAAAGYAEELRGVTGLLSELPSEVNTTVDLRVFGITSLERAQQLLDSIQGFTPDPYGGEIPGESGPTQSQVQNDAADAISGQGVDQGIPTGGNGGTVDGAFASGTGGGFFTVPSGFPNDSFTAGFTSGEKIMVQPSGGGGQTFNGPLIGTVIQQPGESGQALAERLAAALRTRGAI